MTKVNDAIDDWITTKEAYLEAHEISSKADAAHKAAKARLVEAMLAEDRDKVRDTESGLTFDIRNVFSIKCNKGNMDDLSDWLQDHYGDLSEFTKEMVQKKFVTERLKKDIEAEVLDEHEVPEFVGLKTNPDVWCSGWDKFASQRRNEV